MQGPMKMLYKFPFLVISIFGNESIWNGNGINKEWDNRHENLPYKGKEFVSSRIYYQHFRFII